MSSTISVAKFKMKRQWQKRKGGEYTTGLTPVPLMDLTGTGGPRSAMRSKATNWIGDQETREATKVQAGTGMRGSYGSKLYGQCRPFLVITEHRLAAL
jgi:hypothetical protein